MHVVKYLHVKWFSSFVVIRTIPLPWPFLVSDHRLQGTEPVLDGGGSSSAQSLYGQRLSPWHVDLCKTFRHTHALFLCGLTWIPGQTSPWWRDKLFVICLSKTKAWILILSAWNLLLIHTTGRKFVFKSYIQLNCILLLLPACEFGK